MGKPIIYNGGFKYNQPGVVYNGVMPDLTITKGKKNMSLTTTEVFGFADSMDQALTSCSADLQAGGLSVTTWKTEGAALKADAVAKNDAQESAKADLKTKTASTEQALQALYDYYSSKLDAAAGVLGKTTAKGKALLRLRSDIRRGPTAATQQAAAQIKAAKNQTK